jgi:hypothetical protein
MWFVGNGAARGERVEQEPWLVHLVWQLLKGERGAKRLLASASDPFPDAPPLWIRAGVWRYRFSDTRRAGLWWQRERVAEFFPPVSLASEGLRDYVRAYGWPDAPGEEEGETAGR